MKFIFINLLAIASLTVHAQTFQKKYSWKENGLTNSKTNWVDFDNDSLLDVVVIRQNSSSTSLVSFYKNSGKNTFLLAKSKTENMLPRHLLLTDINQDNRMDILLAGQINNKDSVLAVVNGPQLSWKDSVLSLPELAITSMIAKDLDHDGKIDLALGGSDFLKVFQNTGKAYKLQFDSLGVNVQSIASYDYDHDGRDDLMISGTKNNLPVLFFMKNLGKLKFKKTTLPSATGGTIESGDFKHDGKFDVVVNGTNVNQQSQLKYFTNAGKAFQATDSIADYQSGQLLLADVNSDGLSELSFNGRKTDKKRYNQIIDSTGFITDLDTAMVYSQQWGDYDRDGDLDILRVLDSASYFVYQVWENKESKINNRPSQPARTFSVNFFNRTFIYWDKSTDDHTPQKSVTYDISLYDPSANAYYIAPEFDFASKRRLRASHGNQTTNNFMMLPLLPSNFQYLVQAVDNSFTGSKCINGQCNAAPCPSFQVKYVQVCQDNPVEITLPHKVYWFSFNEGFLGESDKAILNPTATDTLVYIDPSAGGSCRSWVLKVNDLSKTETALKYVCQNKPFKLGIEPGWQSVTWKWDSSTETGDTILMTTKKDVVVRVAATIGTCAYTKEFTIRVSIPKLTLNGDYFKIKEGESVTLEATGAKTYKWSPSTGLSNSLSGTTNASPAQTTTYQVLAKDSIQCEAQDNVTVEVEETAFVPTLFTPNGDGKNDEAKIYGLASASEFRFLIYNREGVVVYETTSVAQASSQGWNGSTQGTQQSAGVYYWKIEGTQPNGQPLRLNGKTKGSILLVR
ncbi:MAG: VCBS repeat-containing protein [Bacteroidetes bacterium]|nr:VCBS repeat-containing protein [Bacteroidota bacterium]